MKSIYLTLPVAAASALLLSSCQTINSDASAKLAGVTGAMPSLPIPGVASGEPVELRVGMCQSDVLAALGKPSYQYCISGEETWVYEEGNFIMAKAKETALNMVPCVGPTATLIMGLRPKTESAKAAITFDCDGNICSFKQVEEECADK